MVVGTLCRYSISGIDSETAYRDIESISTIRFRCDAKWLAE